MKDFDKAMEEVFSDKYKEIQDCIGKDKILPTKKNIDQLSKIAFLTADMMDIIKNLTTSHYSELSNHMSRLDDQLKIYKKVMFHIKLDKK